MDKEKLVGYRMPISLRDDLRNEAKKYNMTILGFIRHLLINHKNKNTQ